jgi:outer membrane lipoprotein-sorting protein
MIEVFLSLALFSQGVATDSVNTLAADPPMATAQPADSEAAEDTAPTAGPDRETALAGINAYLNSIETLRARFQQVAPDGSFAEGDVSIARPGRLRFDYDDPSPIQVIADGTTVAIQDEALETVDRIPLRSTPLYWILKRDIDLAEDAEIAGLESEYGFLYLTLRDPRGEMEGELMLVFAEPSYELREWFVTDALGEITRVSLSQVETGMRLDPRLFQVPEPEDRRNSRRGR